MTLNDEAPSALLQRAADRLDEAAGAATKEICPGYVQSAVRHVARNCDIHCGHDEHYNGPDEQIWDPYNDAPWINLMNPESGHAFADVLRAAAAMADGLPEADEIGVVHTALVAARKILGDPS